ncbi:non-ribosomal peptide synthetase [Pseudomonas sp. PA27(2017)]|uniref:non-ribosomal peptide synthetase n=1 Tax=Pseudomonas sp. PA27(2017) TaxID=1932112 RepID=UPI000968ABE5|nr:non-ribosomal peptide synthetase [Pseudomonas sp. PA27(2017)]OLU33798.1 non-ribosomal peptide synthetase [Pseudomonas sp. PA27(2017)]
MTVSPNTLQQLLRDDLSQALDLPAEDIPAQTNLIELGLDSVTMIRLAGQWRRQGVNARFADLIAEPTLAAWLDVLSCSASQEATASEPSADTSQEDFALAPMQYAYWIGRQPDQPLGAVAAHFYNEFDGQSVNPQRLQQALRDVLQRHDMLRAVFQADGRQRIEANRLAKNLVVHDLRDLTIEQAQKRLDQLRASLSHRQLDVAHGEVFDIQLSLLPDSLRTGGTRLHLNLDMLAADALSLRVILADLANLYRGEPLEPLNYSYRCYLQQQAGRQHDAQWQARTQADRDWWLERIAQLPLPPRLPLQTNHCDSTQVVRRHYWLRPEQREAFENHARENGLTTAMALATVFCEALATWSESPDFLLNLPLFDRNPWHADVDRLVGDFTSSILLAWEGTHKGHFAARAMALQQRFHADVQHASFSGLQVLRELSRERGEQVLAPVVYTSALGLGDLFPAGVNETFGTASWIVSQGPQVWLDAQVTELNEGLLVNLDAREALFCEGVLDGLFSAYSGLLLRLCESASAWHDPVPGLAPVAQLQCRAKHQGHVVALPSERLHDRFFSIAREYPQRPALLLHDAGAMSYGELARRALHVAAYLREQGVEHNDVVALQLPKGPDQIIAVLGILACSATYLPIGADQPAARRDFICRAAGARLLLEALPTHSTALPQPLPGAPDDLAYILYTSGSTGQPKGVEISHRAALNTLFDLQRRLQIDEHDRTLALSALEFDLSVFDIFAALGSGAAVICVGADHGRDAAHWLELMEAHQATLLNCVPALLDMLLSASAPEHSLSLRAVLLGGDRIDPQLAPRLWQRAPSCRFMALGGATEAAIHSTLYELPAGQRAADQWHCMPYGKPLDNVALRVVDSHGNDCPDWVSGELWIGGAGVARGYRGDTERTAERFVEHAGMRWYRSGDNARYHPDGTVEFLGRSDFQLKLHGYRIEAGEVEHALQQCQGVTQALVLMIGQRLVACLRMPQAGDMPTQMDPDEQTRVVAQLGKLLPAYMLPSRYLIWTQWPLTGNGKLDRQALLRQIDQFGLSDPELNGEPANPIERQVAQAWEQLLDCPDVGREHNFFSLGGDSLSATRLMRLLADQGIVNAGLPQLYATPVLKDFCASLHSSGQRQGQRLIEADLDNRLLPFPMTEVQQAYYLGRDRSLPLGGVSCHFYREYDVDDLDLQRLQQALEHLVERHEMLRTVFEDGQARILASTPRPVIDHLEVEDTLQGFAQLRATYSERVFDPAQWPLFTVAVATCGRTSRLAIGLDNLILDALSILNFYKELDQLYRKPQANLPVIKLSFRDYQLQAHAEERELAAAQAYWQEHLPSLPQHPQLPLICDPAKLGAPRFARLQGHLPAATWKRLSERAREHDLTASALLLCSFCEVLGRWSSRADLTLNLTLFDRKPLHPQIDQVMGDFTSLVLLGYRPQPGDSWLQRARTTQLRLAEALEHRSVGAVPLLRRLAQQDSNGQASMPVVFTSALGVPNGTEAPLDGPFSKQVFGLSQTPQVWLDHQVVEARGGLDFNWDYVVGLFPEGLPDSMFAAYLAALEQLADRDWHCPPADLLPGYQQQARAESNREQQPVAGDPLLHQGFFSQALAQPGAAALLGEQNVTYAALSLQALRIARLLQQHGVQPGDLVAVSLPRGPLQVASVLGILACGGAYLPIGIDQPDIRVVQILQRSGARLRLAKKALAQVQTIHLDPCMADACPPLEKPVPLSATSLAYVIYTSGSTGEPKGVEITHRAAMNTIADINQRLQTTPADRALAISALEFDLSVYDLFGLLGVGAAVVLLDESQRRDARAWLDILRHHRVTLWNSVPALLDMLLLANANERQRLDLRAVLLSGDWIGMDLPGRLHEQVPGCRFISLGGATEAAIWSNWYEVAEPLAGWDSIPYGRPLRNQAYRVVDNQGRDCPDWVAGELWIGGAGVALGYRNAAELTAERFIGGWYRTGDMGRYRPGAILEFLGRTDTQVKVRGHRIELGEIEAALQRHSQVGRAVVLLARPGRLLAAVTSAHEGRELAVQLADHLRQHLPTYMQPEHIEVMLQLPLNSNGKVDRRALLAHLQATSSTAVDNVQEAPLDAYEQQVADIWRELLQVAHINRHDNFFRLGGDSLLATRFLESLRSQHAVDLPMGALFDAATLNDVARHVAQQAQRDQLQEGVI